MKLPPRRKSTWKHSEKTISTYNARSIFDIRRSMVQYSRGTKYFMKAEIFHKNWVKIENCVSIHSKKDIFLHESIFFYVCRLECVNEFREIFAISSRALKCMPMVLKCSWRRLGIFPSIKKCIVLQIIAYFSFSGNEILNCFLGK